MNGEIQFIDHGNSTAPKSAHQQREDPNESASSMTLELKRQGRCKTLVFKYR